MSLKNCVISNPHNSPVRNLRHYLSLKKLTNTLNCKILPSNVKRKKLKSNTNTMNLSYHDQHKMESLIFFMDLIQQHRFKKSYVIRF